MRRMQRQETEYEQFLNVEKEKIAFLTDGNPEKNEEQKADNTTIQSRAINSSVVEEDEIEDL